MSKGTSRFFQTMTSSVNRSLSSRLITILWVLAWPDRVSCRLFTAPAARALAWPTADDNVRSSSWTTWLEENSIGAARHVSVSISVTTSRIPGFESRSVNSEVELGLELLQLLATWLKASPGESVWMNLLSFSASFSSCAETHRYRRPVASMEQVSQLLVPLLGSIWKSRPVLNI